MAGSPLVVVIRGPMGAGKTTLLRGLARSRRYRFYGLDADAAGAFHPADPYGVHLDDEWPLEIEILALHARIILGRGLNLLTDPGELLTRREVDRFLRRIGRSRRDPRVILLRLTVSAEAAVARKTTVAASYVAASHKGWQPTPVRGEIVIGTDRLTPVQVRRVALGAIRDRVGDGVSRPRVRLPRFPSRGRRS